MADPEVRREVRLLFGVARPQAVIYLLAAPFFLVPGVTEPSAGVASALLLGLGALPFLAALPLAHAGRVTLASWLVISTSLATQMATIVMIGGLRGVLAGSLLLGVLIAGILRGWRAAATTAFVAALFAVGEQAAEAAGRAPLLLPAVYPGAAFVSVIAMLAIAAALLALFSWELRQAAEAVQASAARAIASERRYADLLRLAPDGIAILDADGVVVSANEALIRMGGFTAEEVVGQRLTLLPGIPSDQVRQALKDGLERTFTQGANLSRFDLRRKDGSSLVIETHGRAIALPDGRPGVQVVVRDITRQVGEEESRRRLEEDLRDARRMEGLGRLAGGVAHDFRNLLTPMMVNARLLAEEPDPAPAEVRVMAGEIEAAASKASALTGQLLAFARRQMLDVRRLDLNEVLTGLEPILRRLIREDVTLAYELAPGLKPVRADRSQLEQVAVNLVANARDAMPAGGVITVQTAGLSKGPGEPQSEVLLAVADTGQGMTDEVRAQIFDPFFTTKGAGAGTGLGLATVHGIVAQSGGRIEVHSAPHRGTSFRVILPAAEGEAERAPPPPPAAPRLRAGTRVLVVDDAELPRAAVARALRAHGCEVLEAGGGQEALDLARAAQAPIDAVVTDVVMPGLSGRPLAEAVAALHPEARILFVSGYAEHGVVEEGHLAPGVNFLAKPFTPEALLTRLAELLGRHERG